MIFVLFTLLIVLSIGAHSAGADEHQIVDRFIRFDDQRIQLTIDYIKKHYGIQATEITITPKIIVIHWTGTPSLQGIWRSFNRVTMRSQRRYLVRGGLLNVSAHFLVGRDGTIVRMMPETWMARHCIGLNYDAIGIENVGGAKLPLTEKQLRANAWLVRFLAQRHPIRYLIGHMEWRRFENSPFFRERDPTYRNAKDDPGARFMKQLRARVGDLKLRGEYSPQGARD